MKVQCSCGAKYQFELRSEMRDNPVKFVCPACGRDASDFVDGLIRQELGQTSRPGGSPIQVIPPVISTTAGDAIQHAPPARFSARGARLQQPPVGPRETILDVSEGAPPCLKHPGEVAGEKCHVCSKPICPKCMELFGYVCSPLCKAKADSHGLHIPAYAGQRSVMDARRWRKVVWAGTTLGVLTGALAAWWFWYAWFGCVPKAIFSVRFEQPAYAGQSAIGGMNKDQIVFLHGGTLARCDLKSRKEIWSRQIIDREPIQRAVDLELKRTKALIDKANSEGWDQVPKMPPAEKLAQDLERDAAAAMSLHVRGQNIWVASPQRLARYDWETGAPVKEMTVPDGFVSLITRANELLLLETDVGKPVVTHVDLASGETRREELTGADASLVAEAARIGGSARASKPAGQPIAGLPTSASGNDAGRPMDPSKVAAQAQRLSLPQRIALPATLAGNMNQQRALNELNSQSRSSGLPQTATGPESRFSLVPSKDGFVAFSVKLLEARMVARSAMKGAASKSVLEGNVTAGSSMQAANDMLNEMQRSNGGDVVEEDHSRYQVTLRQAGSQAAWTGDVIGPPNVYPLETVNVLTADKLILVFDKANKKLWQSSLSYNVAGDFTALDERSATYGQGPCVERKGSLYVFDAGVLSVFDLATGNARWRLPTVGVAGLFFDDRDMMYVNTTTASHESLKYSRQIDLSRKVVSVVLKVDSRNGKILWSEDSGGLVRYVSAKLVLTAQSYQPPEQEGPDTGLEKGPSLSIRRLNSRNGREVWGHYQDRAPLDIAFEKNMIRLVFKKEVQVLRFASF